jgi:2,4-dienoyl-CoA reductase-like NADH-dependent reductase (Old Yellow Enzyme family)
MSIVFEPGKIGKLEIKNRFIRSATFESLASDGYVNDKLINFYKALAEGGVGLIITGVAAVQENARLSEAQMGIFNDDFIPGLKKISDVAHTYGNGCKICLQLQHAGTQNFVEEARVAPSAVYNPFLKKAPREMTIDEIKETVEAFAEGIKRAKEAGFDAVQLHAAHGWLLCGFLSPYANIRTDEYGGNTENRIRIVEEIYNRAVELVGTDFPIMIKFNADDFMEGGMDINEAKKIAVRLSKLGYAALEISAGMWAAVTRSEEELGWKIAMLPESRISVGKVNEPAYNVPYAREIKKLVDVPIIAIGGINSLELAEKILNDGSADFIALARPLIREPNLPNRWLKGEGNTGVECIYCNGCISPGRKGLRCITKEKEERIAKRKVEQNQ